MTDNTQGQGHIKNSALKAGDKLASGEILGAIGLPRVSKPSVISSALRTVVLSALMLAATATEIHADGGKKTPEKKKQKTESTVGAPKDPEKKLSKREKKKLITHHLDSLTQNDTTYLKKAKKASHEFAVQELAPDTTLVIDLPFAPLQGATWDNIRLGSIYGHRDAPKTRNGKTGSSEHQGLDVSSRIRDRNGHGVAGDKVVAAGDGEVVAITYDSNGGGGSIQIKHKDPISGRDYFTGYTHVKPYGHQLNRNKTKTVATSFNAVEVGDMVKGGDLIAEIGESGVGEFGGGQNTFPHLHFTATTSRDKSDRVHTPFLAGRKRKIDLRNDIDLASAVLYNKGKAFMFKGETARHPDVHPALMHAVFSSKTGEDVKDNLKQVKQEIYKRVDGVPANRMVNAIVKDERKFLAKYNKLKQEHLDDILLTLPELPDDPKPEEKKDLGLSDYLVNMWGAMDATRLVAGANLSDEMMASLFSDDSAAVEIDTVVTAAPEKKDSAPVKDAPGEGKFPLPQKEQPAISRDPSSSRSEDEDFVTPQPKSDDFLNWADLLDEATLARIKADSEISVAELARQAQQAAAQEEADNIRTVNSQPLFKMQNFRNAADTVRNGVGALGDMLASAKDMVTVPSFTMPQFSMPEFNMPKFKTPSFTMPAMPKFKAPDLSVVGDTLRAGYDSIRGGKKDPSQMSIPQMALYAQAESEKAQNKKPSLFKSVADTVRTNFDAVADKVKDIKLPTMTFSGRGMDVPVVIDGMITKIKKSLFSGSSMIVESRDAAGNVTESDYEHLRIKRDLEVGDMMVAGDVAGFTKGRHPTEIYVDTVFKAPAPQQEIVALDTAVVEPAKEVILSDIASVVLNDAPEQTLEIKEKEIVSDTASIVIDLPQALPVSDTTVVASAEEATVLDVAPVAEVSADSLAKLETLDEAALHAKIDEKLALQQQQDKDAALLAQIVAKAEQEEADQALMDKIRADEEKQLAEKFKADSVAAIAASEPTKDASENTQEEIAAVKADADDNGLATGVVVLSAAALLLLAASRKSSRQKIKAFGLAAALSASVMGDAPVQAEVKTEQVTPGKSDKKAPDTHAFFKQEAKHLTERQKNNLRGKTVKVMGHDVELDDKMLGAFDSIYGRTTARHLHKGEFGERSAAGKMFRRAGVNKADITQPVPPVTETGFIIVPQVDTPLDDAQMERIREASKTPFAQYVLDAHAAKKQKMQPSFS